MSDSDFYGVEIVIGEQQVTYHGGHEPRDFTTEELKPWFNAARELSRMTIDAPCIDAESSA